MDRQTTIGFILIGLVLIVWMWAQAPPSPPQRPVPIDTTQIDDHGKPSAAEARPVETPDISDQLPASDLFGKHFSHLSKGVEKVIIIETDLYTAEITTKGGLIRKWELTGYKTWDQYPVQLVDPEQSGDFSLLFTSTDGKLINTRDLYFESEFRHWQRVELTGSEEFTVQLTLPVTQSRRIVKEITFANGKYSFDSQIRFENIDGVISNYEYQVIWETGIRYAERNSVDESNYAMAYALSGGELIEVDASSIGEISKRDISGATSWIAARNKYFAVAIMPEVGVSQGAYLEGTRIGLPDAGAREMYVIGLKMPLRDMKLEAAKLTVFLGPLALDEVKSYEKGLDQIMSLGIAWLIRPISEYIMLPLFSLLSLFIPNFGFVIIVFSIIIKIVLHPLTKSSMKSMKKMQALQPMMTEIREKYKDDPQKMNQQIMNLYRDYGVNPAGGCLPLLLQMPILYALYMVFSSAIELRQAGFILWITDLSIPDSIIKLPFEIPIFGISEFSGLALAMGVTMFLQQKMTITDPRQKAMVWMMPILMTLLFNGFPSGLNLYYFVFNLLSIGQQMWINKQHGDEPLRRVDRSKKPSGFMGRITRDLPKLKR